MNGGWDHFFGIMMDSRNPIGDFTGLFSDRKNPRGEIGDFLETNQDSMEFQKGIF